VKFTISQFGRPNFPDGVRGVDKDAMEDATGMLGKFV
jgi:hypothetical protein